MLQICRHGNAIVYCLAGEPDLADLVELGVFGPPHGIRGEIRLQAITDSLEERLSEPGAM